MSGLTALAKHRWKRRICKVSFLSKTWETKPISIGLSIHFLFWWAFSVWFWTKGYGWTLVSFIAPIAPIYLGTVYLLSSAYREWAAAGLLVSFALIGMTLLAAWHRYRWLTLLTHFAVLLYWFVGFVLISTGV